MKFLVLAVVVCAASAATFPDYNRAKAFASVSVSKPAYNVQVENKPVVEVPFVPVTKTFTKNVAAGEEYNSEILKSDFEIEPEKFAYSFETSNGIAAAAQGVVKNVNNEPALSVQGQFAYTDANGTPVQVNYVADENGYQPDSAILPVGPAIPDAILRSLEYIRTHPSKEETVRRV